MKHIKEKIVIGKWQVGSKIPSENELCKELGYSRTSIRSAIQRYNELGVLESQKGRGTFVISAAPFFPDRDLYSDLFGNKKDKATMETFNKWRQVRSIIEPQVVYKVAENATPELIEKLKRINNEQFEAIGNLDEFIAKDVEFHMTIAGFLENDILNNIMQVLFSMKEMMLFGNEEFGYSGGGYFHMQITDAIEKHDAKRASDLMREHQAEYSRLYNSEKNN